MAKNMQRFLKTKSLYNTVQSDKERELGLGKDFEAECFWVDAVIDLEKVTDWADSGQNLNEQDKPYYEVFIKNSTNVRKVDGDIMVVPIAFADFCKIMGVE